MTANNSYQEYEIRQALVVTGVLVIVVGVLIGCYAIVEHFHPTPIVEGKIKYVSDPWILLRSLCLKSAGVLVGAIAVAWGLLGFNHITPKDYFSKLAESPIATSIFQSSVLFALAYMWCFG